MSAHRLPATPPLDLSALVERRPSAEVQEFLRALAGPGAEGESAADVMRRLQRQVRDFLLEYKFGLDEVATKVGILREQFDATAAISPIEHVKTRVKSPESLSRKVAARGLPGDLDQIRAQVRDIAGVRITCPYVADVRLVAAALERQGDLTVLEVKDYIASPKPNGYRSLHLIVEVPVFLADRTVQVPVEIQIRTIAMDFWASAEHELRYKFDGRVPEEHSRIMVEIAETACALDDQMSELRRVLLT
ncbi:GTP pyrophosphokinase family protein [Brachybacterium sp. JHP9]|uniref:GTP pyrophosphokinase family protein n=1 Tax=Brachybacterium equifaecis TaxID=2910770 RepID=A0ABT0QYX1_9MICO|nr:GTP pyrophosphokinase family protein [Brachybacterium equifaecis]MCL6422851.1 GTP pyrophosphokinase family protein [Brachybacterium equifaecis]